MNATEQFIYLSVCGSLGKKAALESADFEKLWETAQEHNMTALLAKALSFTQAFKSADASEQNRWNSALNTNIKKCMRFDAERKTISAFLEKNGIWHIPLKGAVINGLYPYYGTREFADNDILYDGGFRETVKTFMTGRGYELMDNDHAADDYIKKPLFNFEMHGTLFLRDSSNESFFDYYRGMLDRRVTESGKQYTCRFSDNDFYIYFILHALKHYDGNGTGFRTLADEYVILHSPRFRFDFDFIGGELKKMHADGFERKLRELAEAVFGFPGETAEALRELTDEQTEMLSYILFSGTFGGEERRILWEYRKSANGKKPSKAKYFFRRVFPPVSRYEKKHPFVYRHKIVYPFFLIYRMTAYPLLHRRSIKRELKTVKSLKE